MPDAALLDNHLAFLAAHRGEVRRSATGIELVGESAEFSAWIPLSPSAELPAGTATVRLVPWSGEGWEERLTVAGFLPAEVLVHMEAPVEPTVDAPSKPAPPSTLTELTKSTVGSKKRIDYDFGHDLINFGQAR